MDIKKTWNGLSTGFRTFLLQLLVAGGAFILISFLIGGAIVPGPLLYGLGFFFYGGLGYIVLAMAVFFVVFARKKLLKIDKTRWGYWWVWPITAGLTYAFYTIGWYVKRNPLLVATQPLYWGAILHSIFALIFITLLFAVFHWTFLVRFLSKFRKELLICLAIGIGFYAAMRVVWLSWPYLSWAVSRLVFQMLRVFPGDPILTPPLTISVSGFSVRILEPCSGVFSIFLFTCLYLLVVALDWKKLVGWKVAVGFVGAVVGLFLTNVVRVYSIIIAGVYTSPEFAANLFHSYVGMILFIVFFAVFQWLTWDWMQRK